jgi:hypothetical protein
MNVKFNNEIILQNLLVIWIFMIILELIYVDDTGDGIKSQKSVFSVLVLNY